MRRPAKAPALLLAALVLTLAASGCSKNDPTNPVSNVPPETHLSFAPGQGDTVSYVVRMNWFGWDPDGDVDHYMTRWDSLVWTRTSVTESTFVVPVGDSTAPREHFQQYHTFEVKAVDDCGDEDPTPDGVAFTAENFSPETEILSGPMDVADPFVTFQWAGSDPEGEIAGYGYRLVMIEVGSEIEFEAGTLPGTVTAIELGPLYGFFRFEVWSIDGQGVADPTPAERTFFVWNGGDPGHGFHIRSNVLADTDEARWWRPYPDVWEPVPVDVFAGEHVTFDWSHDEQGVEFRYAYGDTTNWAAWSETNTHFELTVTPGLHEIHVACRNASGYICHVHARLEGVEASLDEHILLVDDYTWRESNSGWMSDAERDAFYDAIVAPFGERYQWDPAEHEVNGSPVPPGVEDLASASTVVWYCDIYTEWSVIDDVFYPYSIYDVLSGYVRAGGNLFLCGSQVLGQIVGDVYPVVSSPGDEGFATEFVRDVLRVGYADYSGSGLNPNAPYYYGFCMHGAVPTAGGEALGFEPVYIDSGDCSGEVGRWPYYCDPPPPYPGLWHCGIQVEKLEAYQAQAVELLATDAFLNYNFDGEPSAVIYLSGDDRGNVCYVGFPLAFTQTDHAEALLRRALTLFGEQGL